MPIVSFIARQRDLRELVGVERTGAESLSFQDQLSYWDVRFATVTLEDRNLQMIAEKRILRPRDGEAARRIADAFCRTDNLPGLTCDILLTDGDGEAFRRTYPFSPAFMPTLVHVSSALQRERTALKLMQQILVDQRDDLRLGQLVPLGDLFDAIADGNDQPFTEKLQHELEQARTLNQRTLRPLPFGQRRNVNGDVHWWTWAGSAANRSLRATLGDIVEPRQRIGDGSLRLGHGTDLREVAGALERFGGEVVLPEVDARAVAGLKFSAALPEELAVATIGDRLGDRASAPQVITEPRRLIVDVG